MLTNPLYKSYAREVSNLFCKEDQICYASVYQRILTYFSNNAFEQFLQNINQGRWSVLRYSNWRQGNNCRDILINVKLTDVITGNVTTGYWYYTAENCTNKQYYYPDLNALMNKNGCVLMDSPIASNSNAEVTKERLVWKPGASSYGITYVPGQVGTGGNIVVTPSPVPVSNVPVNQASSFDLKNIFDNPMLLIGGAAVLFFLLMKD